MRAFLFGLSAGIVAAAAVGSIVVASGAIDMAAREDDDMIDSIGRALLARSVAMRAPDTESPLTDRRAAALAGHEHYRDTCVHCHGAPGVPRSEWASGLSPRAPALDSDRVQARSDAELFHLIQSGIRLTGMPAFGSDHTATEIWELVTFLRSLDALTEAQKEEMRAVTRGTHRHGPEPGEHRPHAHDGAEPHPHDEPR